MISGKVTAPTHPSQATDDPTSPMYDFQEDYWEEPPELFDSEREKTADNTIREITNKKYGEIGDAAIWNRYVAFGYHQFDDCITFAATWKRASEKDDPLDKYKIIWNEYALYLIHQEEPTNSNLYAWTHNIALPYIHKHDPDYHLASVYEIEDTIQKQLPRDITHPLQTEWIEIGTKKKRAATTSSPDRNTTPKLANINKRIDASTKTKLTSLGNSIRRVLQPSPSNTKTPAPPRLDNNPSENLNQNTIRFATSNDATKPINIHNNHNQSTYATNQEPPLAKARTVTNPYKNPSHRNTTSPPQQSTQSSTKNHSPDTDSLKGGSTSMQSTMNTKTIPFIPINDGTVRMTIKWRLVNPETFHEMSEDPALWEQEAMNFLVQLFGHNHDTQPTLIPWTAPTTNNPQNISAILENNSFQQYRSPKIAKLASTHQFIFGVRVCLGTNAPGPWITNTNTQAVMRAHNLTINISNAKSDSGEITSAGTIFFKHPHLTQRNFYLMSLRRSLPPSTPFFDIISIRTTPQGKNIPHLIVRCGANHVDTLTEILSEYLDGSNNNTALFLANKVLKSMSQEEAHATYETHQKYVDSIQRLPLYPAVINIDRIRTEHQAGQVIERSTREWVSTLRTAQGQPMKCDVENGGEDKRAYMLAPSSCLQEAKHALAIYQSTIKHNYKSTHDSVPPRETATRPTEIYVPTAAVLRNLHAMQRMQETSEDIWKAAPAAVRGTTNHQMRNDATSQHTGHFPSATQGPQAKPLDHHQANNPYLHHKDTTANTTTPTNRRPSLDTTVGTTQSPMTGLSAQHTQTSNNRRFDDIEASFMRHQAEFSKTSERMTTLEDQVHRTMSACEQLSQQVTQMDSRFTSMLEKLETMLTIRLPISTETIPANADAKTSQFPRTTSSDESMGSDTNTQQSKESTASTTIQSPKKKKSRSSTLESTTDDNTKTNEHDTTQTTTDQIQAQYTHHRLSDEEEDV